MSQPLTYQEMLAEHEELGRRLESLRTTLAAKHVDPAVAMAMIDDLHRRVREHFEHEEQQGYFRQIAQRAPWLGDRVQSLKEQHPVLLAAFTRVVEDARRVPPGASWSAIVQRVEGFFVQYAEHEEEEDRLLQEVYDRDVGPRD